MTLEEIDKRLAKLPSRPTTDSELEARRDLMLQRCELANAERNAAERPQKQPGDIVCFVPPQIGTNVLQTRDGDIVAEVIEGRVAFRLRSLMQFRNLLSGAHGLLWERENVALMESIGGARLPPIR